MFKTISTSGLAILGALTASLVLPMAASAAPFTLDNIEPKGFDCATASATGLGALNCASGTPNHIEWVQSADPLVAVSSLDLLSLTTINGVNAGDPPVRINKLTHTNVVIPQAFNYSIDIVNTIQVTDENGGAIVLIDTGAINIAFTETPNSGPPCTNPNPAATICDDFFDFDAGGLAPVLFSAGGINYKMIFGLETGDGAFFDGIRDNRIYTAESATSVLYVTARIVALDVPEPMTLALLGLGLLGIGFAARQRKM